MAGLVAPVRRGGRSGLPGRRPQRGPAWRAAFRQERARVLGEDRSRPAVSGVRVVDVARPGDARHELAGDLGWIGDVAATGRDEGWAADGAEVTGRVEGVVGVGVDPERAQIPAPPADVR